MKYTFLAYDKDHGTVEFKDGDYVFSSDAVGSYVTERLGNHTKSENALRSLQANATYFRLVPSANEDKIV